MAPSPERRAAVLTVSDRASGGASEDLSGPLLERCLEIAGWEVAAREIAPDEPERIAEVLRTWADADRIPLILTTGGTGIGHRDVTPDATRLVLDREVAGIAEAIRHASLAHTPHAMLSRAVAGIRGGSLIVNLPGNPAGAGETFDVLAPVLEHAFRLLTGVAGDQEHRS